ncbi:MAG: SDR family oxidoreductase [Actinobacteria bacterium]|nr:MAG: SDR family oxidoreductase [Actinomycetota bacterium]
MTESKPVALITGASAGIGESFGRALAARGHDLVVVARDEGRLMQQAEALGLEHGASIEVVAADLTTPAGVARVESRLGDRDRPIDLLVNNAGFGTSGSFAELPIDTEVRMIELNIVTLVRLTHAALAPMLERDRGGVINVSSLGAYQPTPFSATYAATKAFVSSFTQAVHEELQSTNVRIMVLAPGFTRTEFHDRNAVDIEALPDWFWSTSDEVVAHALRAYESGRTVCIPGALNAVAGAFSSVMPAGITRKIAKQVMRRT